MSKTPITDSIVAGPMPEASELYRKSYKLLNQCRDFELKLAASQAQALAYRTALQEAVTWDSHDDRGVPAVWLKLAEAALTNPPPAVFTAEQVKALLDALRLAMRALHAAGQGGDNPTYTIASKALAAWEGASGVL